MKREDVCQRIERVGIMPVVRGSVKSLGRARR